MIELNSDPKIVIYDNFISARMCQRILNLIEHHKEYVGRSKVGYDAEVSSVSDSRTSSSIYDALDHLRWLRRKITDEIVSVNLPGVTIRQGELLQAQQYTKGQHYQAHYDFFNIDKNIVTTNDRIATVIIYLNDDFSGGQTRFPILNWNVIPKTGRAVFFDYSMDDLAKKKLTFHSGEPVISGNKTIVTAWYKKENIV